MCVCVFDSIDEAATHAHSYVSYPAASHCPAFLRLHLPLYTLFLPSSAMKKKKKKFYIARKARGYIKRLRNYEYKVGKCCLRVC